MPRKNIVLCSAPRSGSTWFLKDIAEQNPGMIDHHESLRTLGHGYEQHPKSDAERKAQFKQVMRNWTDPSKSNCVKVFPLMLTEARSPWRKRTFFQDLLNDTDELYFLMRRDFSAQVRSAIVAFYKTMTGDINFHGDWDEEFFVPDDDILKQITATCERQMYAQNMQLVQLWHNTETDVPTKLLFLEDIDQKGKYHRPVSWERIPSIQSVDWESLLQRDL